MAAGSADGRERKLKVPVLEIGSGNVRLGFEVDAAVPVHDLEAWEELYVSGLRPRRERRRSP